VDIRTKESRHPIFRTWVALVSDSCYLVHSNRRDSRAIVSSMQILTCIGDDIPAWCVSSIFAWNSLPRQKYRYSWAASESSRNYPCFDSVRLFRSRSVLKWIGIHSLKTTSKCIVAQLSQSMQDDRNISIIITDLYEWSLQSSEEHEETCYHTLDYAWRGISYTSADWIRHCEIRSMQSSSITIDTHYREIGSESWSWFIQLRCRVFSVYPCERSLIAL